jgi:signal transduction histidine kinase
MKERVDLVDGKLDIESRPGGGTRVVVWVPSPAIQNVTVQEK